MVSVADADGNLLADELGRFENLAADAVRWCPRAGVDCASLPTTNAAPHHHYSAYYSAFGRELIAQRFSEDVVQLGYHFDETNGEAASAA